MSKKQTIRNSMFFHDYYSRLKNIALSIFEWEGLPPTCNARFLEDCLFHYGTAIFVNDPDMSFLNVRGTPSDTLNVYNEPLSYHAFATGYSRFYRREECVYIRNNYLERSTHSTIILYAEKLAELDLAIQVNTNAQKTPVLIRCDEKTRLTLEAVYNQYEGNRPVIWGTKSLMDKPLDVLRTEAPFIADKLREEKRAVWNEALEFLGLNTNPSDKKRERLIVSEVDANNEQIDIQSACMLLTRQQACVEINRLWGLPVKVRKRLEGVAPAEDENTEEEEVTEVG